MASRDLPHNNVDSHAILAPCARSVARLLAVAPAGQSLAPYTTTVDVTLCARYRRLVAAGKAPVVVTSATAREMVGFLWAIARHVELASAT